MKSSALLLTDWCISHSSMSLQIPSASGWYPGSQMHLYPGSRFSQVPWGQIPGIMVHSLMSAPPLSLLAPSGHSVSYSSLPGSGHCLQDTPHPSFRPEHYSYIITCRKRISFSKPYYTIHRMERKISLFFYFASLALKSKYHLILIDDVVQYKR